MKQLIRWDYLFYISIHSCQLYWSENLALDRIKVP